MNLEVTIVALFCTFSSLMMWEETVAFKKKILGKRVGKMIQLGEGRGTGT